MNILVTAGNSQAPIDRVRCITNIFSGRTGAGIAERAAQRGHGVTLVTSHPEVVEDLTALTVCRYRTFDELALTLETMIRSARFDAVIHAAAVGDFAVAGAYVRQGDQMSDVSAEKIRSNHDELWLRLTPTPKLVDRFRTPWGFNGTLVKFKLEVGVTPESLESIAEQSRLQSSADWMCANTLDEMHDWAILGRGPGDYRRIARRQLADAVIDAAEATHRERRDPNS